MKVDYSRLGDRVRKERMKKAMTQEQLAEKAVISIKHVGSIERAESIPSIQVLVDLAQALEVTPDYLLFDTLDKEENIYENQILFLIRGKSEKFKEHILKYIELLCNEKW